MGTVIDTEVACGIDELLAERALVREEMQPADIERGAVLISPTVHQPRRLVGVIEDVADATDTAVARAGGLPKSHNARPRRRPRVPGSVLTICNHRRVDEAAKPKRINEGLEQETSSNCEKHLGQNRVSSGRRAEGVFWSLGCQATLHAGYYDERQDWGSPGSN